MGNGKTKNLGMSMWVLNEFVHKSIQIENACNFFFNQLLHLCLVNVRRKQAALSLRRNQMQTETSLPKRKRTKFSRRHTRQSQRANQPGCMVMGTWQKTQLEGSCWMRIARNKFVWRSNCIRSTSSSWDHLGSYKNKWQHGKLTGKPKG
jgi:hypothetical protein